MPHQDFTNKASARADPSSTSAAASTADPAKTVGTAAPTESFQQLKTFTDIYEQHENKAFDISDRDDAERIKKEMAELRAPVQDLISACKAVGSDLDRGLKATAAPKAKAVAKAKGKAKDGEAGGCFALLPKMPEIRVLSENCPELVAGELALIDHPFIVKTAADLHSQFEKDSKMQAFVMKEFLGQFNAQNSVAALERAGRKLPAELEAFVWARATHVLSFIKLVMNARSVPSLPSDLQDVFDIQAVICGRNSSTVSREKGYAASLRYALAGSDRSDFCTRHPQSNSSSPIIAQTMC